MKKEKFLTVFAVFDQYTQKKLSLWQNKILENGFTGTQTMGIPFHITLGSFPLDKEAELCNLIDKISKEEKSFSIELKEIKTFGNKVLFLQPIANQELMHLHEKFNCNYADGLNYHPHTTIFCGIEEEVCEARELLKKEFQPFKAVITEIHLGEFFPTRMIYESKLQA